MAQTRIEDLVGTDAGALSNLVTKSFAVNNSLVTSGVAVTGPEADILMQGGSAIQKMNHLNKVDTSVFNYSSDNFDEKGATGKITASPYFALRHDMNWGWTYTDLLKIITKFDVKTRALPNAIPLFWSEVAENLAIASMKGALGAEAGLTIGDGTDAFDVDLLIDAAATLQNPQSNKSIYCSRKTLAKMQKQNKNAYVPAAETNLGFATFADHRLVITEAFGDGEAVTAEDGAFAFSAGLVPGEIGMEYDRDPNAGNGGGGEILRTRMSMVVAPQGFSYVGEEKPGVAGLALNTNWLLAAEDIKDVGFRSVKFTA